MDAQQYITERVDDQINWMEGKASHNQSRFKQIRIVELICSASIPFLVALISDSTDALKWVAGAFGVTVTICEGLQVLYKYQELWMQYRSTVEALRKEKILYLSKAGRYDGMANPFPSFVVEVESILGQENVEWKKHIEKIEKEK